MAKSICEGCIVRPCCSPGTSDCKKIIVKPSELFQSIRVDDICPDCGRKDFKHVRKSSKNTFDNQIKCIKCGSKFEMWARWDYRRVGEEYDNYYSKHDNYEAYKL